MMPTKTPERESDEQLIGGGAGVATRVRQWAGKQDPVPLVLGGAILVWSLVFVYLGWIRHTRYATFAFDLGIYDQGTYLLSRLEEPFVTIRGLHLFGHHANFILVLFAPFYRLGIGGPIFLLVVQVAAQASGAVAIYLLAKERLADRWLAVVLGVVLLLHPSFQLQVLHFFHPDSLAIGPVLFAYWAARTERWRWFAVAAVLAVACKEDVALVMAVMGGLIFVRGNRRVGVTTVVCSIGYYLLATRILMPEFLGGLKPFYDSFFGEFGESPGEVARNVIANPSQAFNVATESDRLNYYRMMFAPVAFLPIAALPTLLVAAPMMLVVALTTWPYAREIQYHYSSLVLAGIMLATVEGIASATRNRGARRFLVGLVAATSLAATVAWGASPISTKYRSGIWPLEPDARLATKEAAASLVPDDVAVSAMYYFVPQLDHRERIYVFPVPWMPTNWAVSGENLHDPAKVDWLVLDRQLLSEEDQGLVSRLLDDEFTVRFDQDAIVVAERTRAPVAARSGSEEAAGQDTGPMEPEPRDRP